MIIIGEKINSSIPVVSNAIDNRDKAFIEKLAMDQVHCGANFIDVNAGAFLEKEKELLVWLVETVQAVTNVPLCIDSPNPHALAAALAVANKKGLINSISAEADRYAQVIPLIKEHKFSVIALCMDDRGIPKTVERRLEIAQSLTDKLVSDGVSLTDIYFDIMLQPIATDDQSGKVALETVRAIKEKIPGAHITCGLSNGSFGLPKRKLLNQAFAVSLAANGMDTLFIDPNDEKLMALLYATQLLIGCDEFCGNYLTSFRSGKLG